MKDLQILLIDDDINYMNKISESIKKNFKEVTIIAPSNLEELNQIINKKEPQFSAVICDYKLDNFNPSKKNSIKKTGYDMVRQFYEYLFKLTGCLIYFVFKFS